MKSRQAEGSRAYGFERDAMGTRFRIVLFTSEGSEAARSAAEAAFELILELERKASDWREESELSQASRALEHDGEVEVSSHLADLFALCLEMRERSGGSFDPAIGAATRLWRRAARQGEEPSQKDLERLRKSGACPWELEGTRLYLPPASRRTASSATAGTTIRFDLGAVAKGAALDLALAELERRGIRSALVEGGGDLVCGDAPPGSEGWQIE
ncbi:MAG: FAD:protein FMN transferase, partial [Planctomycetota bacterium]